MVIGLILFTCTRRETPPFPHCFVILSLNTFLYLHACECCVSIYVSQSTRLLFLNFTVEPEKFSRFSTQFVSEESEYWVKLDTPIRMNLVLNWKS